MRDWGEDAGSQWTARLRCTNAWCDEYGSVWRSAAVTQYGATEYQKPECPEWVAHTLAHSAKPSSTIWRN